MKKIISKVAHYLLIVVIAYAVSFTHQELKPKSPESPVLKIHKSLVKLSRSSKPRDAYGSGVIIKSSNEGSIILTNKHVCMLNTAPFAFMKSVHEYGSLHVYHNTSKKTYVGHILKVSINTDLCLVSISAPNLPVVKMASKTPAFGSTIYNVSNPIGIIDYNAKGTLGSSIYLRGHLYVQTSINVYPGSSGSGVFDEDGRLIGLIARGIRGTAISFMVPLNHVKFFVGKL